MKNNPNKAVSAKRYGITISYTDSCKHYSVAYEENNILKTLQMQGNKYSDKSYQNIGKENYVQLKIYRTALYGLSVFTPEEVNKMSFAEKTKITSTQKKVQSYLNAWKQEICHRKLGSFLTTFFKNSTFAVQLANYPEYMDKDNRNKMHFKDLGITRDMVVQKLISVNLLPHNYYELK